MNTRLFLLVLLLLLVPILETTAISDTTDSGMKNRPAVLNSVKGVAVIDDLHGNDYTQSDTTRVYEDLNERGFLTFYASEFASWEVAVSKAHYLIISAPYTEYPAADITVISNWFINGSKNIILASRGDFASVDFASMNSILSGIGATTRVQDDNVYTTDPNARQEWHIISNNFNTSSQLFVGVDSVNLFSPSSVTDTASNEILINAEIEAYQSNQNDPAPAVIYDDTNDGAGGDAIPLAAYEEITTDGITSRIVVIGTTLWSDFDYGDSSAQDTLFFDNVLEYFVTETQSFGPIVIEIPDTTVPTVKITDPHAGAVLSGTVTVDARTFDHFGIDSVEILIDNIVVGSSLPFVWNTSSIADGKHSLTINAFDAVGNKGSSSATYTVKQGYIPILDDQVKIMTYNIKESGVFPQWVDVMKEENADIIMLVETGDFDDSSNALLTSITTELNVYFFDEINYKAVTLQDIPKAWNGITLLSRFEITSSNIIDKVILDNGAPFDVFLPFLQAEISVFDQPVQLIGTHLTCCTGGLDSRLKEMEGIINFIDDLGDKPVILLGDMNSQSPDDFSNPADATLGTEPLSMLLDLTHPKASKVHMFQDVHTELNPSTSGFSYGGYSRIDYIFTNQWFMDRLISSTTGDTESAERGSDHVSVDVVINFSSALTRGDFTIPPLKSTTTPVETTKNSVIPGLLFATSVVAIILIVKMRRRNY